MSACTSPAVAPRLELGLSPGAPQEGRGSSLRFSFQIEEGRVRQRRPVEGRGGSVSALPILLDDSTLL